jgi:lipopolysaccharide transport system ATP-binding protein
MGQAAIQVEKLGKRFRLGQRERYRRLSEVPQRMWAAAAGWWSGCSLASPERPPATIWALRDVSFEVPAGEALGIIGSNGAGKSTLLKILSRITRPTEGEARMRGRVGSLLEVGTGFHPELTGRENIYLNGAILGMRKAEIRQRFDEIVAFSELEKFLDTQVKHYSSGMHMRLAFAVAAHLEPEVLLVDEVLAVGDVEFQRKCLGRMNTVAQEGRTVLFVSHNMGAVSRLCNRAICLSDGQCVFDGDVAEAILRYTGFARAGSSYVDLRHAPTRDQTCRTPMLQFLSTHRDDGTPTASFRTGETLVVRVGFRLPHPLEKVACTLMIQDALGDRVMTLSNLHHNGPFSLPMSGVLECRAEDLRLAPGTYHLAVELDTPPPLYSMLDYVRLAAVIHCDLGEYLGGAPLLRGQGLIAQRSRWSLLP